MKLISMTDYVLQKQMSDKTIMNIFIQISNYAKFLKQPLELWMFVPCDLVMGKVIVLDKPKEHLENRSLYFKELEIYSQAKERCLFDGFKSGFRIPEHKVFNAGDLIFSEEENIENLLQYKNKTFTLTASSKKQLGL